MTAFRISGQMDVSTPAARFSFSAIEGKPAIFVADWKSFVRLMRSRPGRTSLAITALVPAAFNVQIPVYVGGRPALKATITRSARSAPCLRIRPTLRDYFIGIRR